ncbi:MAG: Rpn family recombination-promoting nuclease/putative transposase [Chlamydiales bacterium]|nr:Rpn family recombination-promoting nuclease/putative transposase [Chlamydiales bacterium]
MAKYLIPTADVVFKKIFGGHPHLLKSFLNAVLPLPDDGQIVSLNYLSGEQIPSIPEFKRTIVDVKCIDQQGRVFIVEMQTDWIGGFMQRMLFNSASAYVQQLKKGESYRLLCPVYGLGIIADSFEFQDPSWYHHYQIVNIKNPVKKIEGLEFVFIELPKFKPANKTEKYLQVLWLRFLSELDEATRTVPPEFLTVPEIREACALSEEAAYTKEELEGYNKYWDAISTAKTLAQGNLEEGIVKGRAEGRAEGKAEGILEGIQKGKTEEKVKLAYKLVSMNMLLPDIAVMLETPPEELEKLLAESMKNCSHLHSD